MAANALGHGLAAFDLRPAWWVVVVVSAIAPAVLGAVVHLAVLVGRPDHMPHVEPPAAGPPFVLVDETAGLTAAVAAAVEDGALDEYGLSRAWQHAPASRQTGDDRDRAAALIAAGAGRRRLARELAISEYEARQLLHRTRGGGTASTTAPDVEARTDDAAAALLHAVNGAGGPQ